MQRFPIGATVLPSPELEQLRPEVAGASGQVVRLEDEGTILVQWPHLERLYRVPGCLVQDQACNSQGDLGTDS